MVHTIRILTPSDAVAYTVLRREMLFNSPWAFLRSPDDDPGCNAVGLAASMSRPSGGFSIAGGFTVENELVAVAGIRREEPVKSAHRATLWGVYVTPSHRVRGLGRSVVDAAVEAARNWLVVPRIESVGLSVSEKSLAASALYAKMGFVPWGAEPDAVRVDGQSLAETHMYLRLRRTARAL
ncbi:MAG: GNAT family N-acetyltransferase [Phycisphaerales bacterium]|nr:GNAT family N-acetyltransferase [Phycisphaerales bacterium]